MQYIIVLLILILLGCGKKTEEAALEKAIEAQTGGKADVDVEDEGISIKSKTDEGEFSMSAGKSAKLPENFPSDVYVYKGASVMMVMQIAKGQSVTLQTQDGIDEVADKYKKEMGSKGWEQKAFMDMGKQRMMTYAKKDRIASVTIAKDKKQTNIVLGIGRK